MKACFTAIILFVTCVCLGQNVTGYYVTPDGTRTAGYFKAANFFNENNLYFSISASGTDYKKIEPATIAEYGAGNDGVFKKYTVSVDDSKLMGTDLGTEKMPVWVTRTVFLNVIVEGDASLYSYSSDKGLKFFYKVPGKNIELNQLMYKQYMATQSTIGENVQFRQQLYNNVNCDGAKASQFANIKYKQAELEKVFTRYNTCVGSANGTSEMKTSASKGVKYAFTLLAGIAQHDTKVKNEVYPGVNNGKTAFTGGAEVSLTLPNEYLTFFLRALYQDISFTENVTYASSSRTSTDEYVVNSGALNVYVGPRYNFLFGEKQVLFVDAAFAFCSPFGKFNHEHTTVTDLGTASYKNSSSLRDKFFYSAGLGYQFNQKYGIEAHYETSKKFSGADLSTITINSFTVNLRYTF